MNIDSQSPTFILGHIVAPLGTAIWAITQLQTAPSHMIEGILIAMIGFGLYWSLTAAVIHLDDRLNPDKDYENAVGWDDTTNPPIP